MSMRNTTGSPIALPLIFTHYEKSLYDDDVKCLYDNDSFTEVLNEDLDSFVLNPWAWNKGGITDPAFIILVPVSLITIATNILVLQTFIREHLLSAIHIILIAMAISNTLTVLVPSMAIIYLMSDGVEPDYIRFEYCQTYGYLTKYLPTITHTASIWLTVVLATDRYLAVEHPFYVRRTCFPKTSVCIIVVVYSFAILGHISRFLDTDYVPVKIISGDKILKSVDISTPATEHMATSSRPTVNASTICRDAEGIFTCRAVYTPFFETFYYYEFLYYWFVIIFVKFIPCSCLICLDTLMLRSLKRAETFRKICSSANVNKTALSTSKYTETQRTTIIIVVAIIVVVIVELPIGVILIFWTLSEIHGTTFLSESALNTLSRTANMVVYISYPILFLIYCSISTKFRQAFCRFSKCMKPSNNQAVEL